MRWLSAFLLTVLLAVPATARAHLAWPASAGVPPAMERAGERFGVAPRLMAAVGLSEFRHGTAACPASARASTFSAAAARCCCRPPNNAGPGNVRRFGGVPPFAETRGYACGGVRLMARLRR